jgi:uncharacterized repeat protein (TIGR01451 family)
MTHRMTWSYAVLCTAALVASATATAQDATRGCIELKTVGEIEQSYVDAAGKQATRLVPAAKVVPGDEVVWTITASNICTNPAADVAITNPVPAHMSYVGGSAFGPGSKIEFSLDGKAFGTPESLIATAADGTQRSARADEYTHVRWVLGQAIGPSETLVVRYRARVN